MELNNNLINIHKDYSDKEFDAIECVKRNLRQLHSLIYDKNVDIIDQMPSLSASLIKVNLDKSYGRNDDVLLKIIQEQLDREKLTKKYLVYIDTLDEFLNTLITQRYIHLMKVRDIAEASNIEYSKIFEYYNRAYIILAVLDNDIDYDINDYIELQQRLHKFEYSLRASVKLLLNKAYSLPESNPERVYVNKVLDLMNSNFREALEKVFLDKKPEITKNEYKLVQRGVYQFAFIHKDIELNRDLYCDLLKKTGKGYLKALASTNSLNDVSV